MSQYRKNFGWMVALGLSACAVVPKGLEGLGPQANPAVNWAAGQTQPATILPQPLTPSDLPKIEGQVQRTAGIAKVTLTIRWPARRAVQAIPESANRIRVLVRDAAGRDLGAGEVTRGSEPTSTLVLDAVEVPDSGEATVLVDAFDADGFRSASGQALISLEPNVEAPVRVALKIRPQVVVDLQHMPEAFRRRDRLSLTATLPDGRAFEADWGDAGNPTDPSPDPTQAPSPPSPSWGPTFPPTPQPSAWPGAQFPARVAFDLPDDGTAAVALKVRDLSNEEAARATGTLDPLQEGGGRLTLAPIGAVPEAKYLYVHTDAVSTASVNAVLAGQQVRLATGVLKYPDLVGPRIFIGKSEVPAEVPFIAYTPTPGDIRHKVVFSPGVVPSGKVQLVHMGATASFQPDFFPIASASISPATASVARDATASFSVRAYDVAGADIAWVNPFLGFWAEGGASLTREGLFTGTSAGTARVNWGIIGQSSVATAEAEILPKPMEWASIDPGTFVMGEPGETYATHSVTLTRGFYMQKTHVTQEQWQALMGNNPSGFQGCGDCPVEQVSWFDAIGFANALSRKEGLPEVYNADGTLKAGADIYATTGYRLPTEAEWEYAYRAGTTTRWYNGDDESKVGDIAWFSGNSNGRTQPVAQKQPNAFGLYDMAGNVYQWTNDRHANYPGGEVTDPAGPESGSTRVVRGGSLYDDASNARAAVRYHTIPGDRGNFMGFRLARSRP